MKRLLTSIALAAALAFSLAGPAHAQSDASAASVGASMLSGILIVGSVGTLGEGSGQMVVSSVQSVGESTTVALKNISNGAAVSVKVASSALREAGVSVGTAVQATAEASGYALMASGKLIAFIPNEIGASLLGSSQTGAR
jgi:hypothetical protein